MKFLVRNRRGAGNDTFKNNMKAMIITYRFEVVIILETKVEITKMRNFFNRAVYDDWVLSAVYASPNHRNRDEFGNNNSSMANSEDRPCVLAWDFNDYHRRTKRRSLVNNNRVRSSCENDQQILRLSMSQAEKICKTYDQMREVGRAGCGGLVRNERADWIKGIYGRLLNCSALEAERWAVHGGLNLAMQEGINSIVTPMAWWKSSMKDHTREPHSEISFANAGA
ncbi:hypothetical protein Acr_17g0013600 [Actinidia rufa]|uniref:RNase H type-1 domain-containing protein n=1 Tax=Actinidia rufa TaxID=165716 RepID=A0A7J0G4S3_9ERIC|nr:hypothetical protein Acr_17g0013600 [Actinidia rufa]